MKIWVIYGYDYDWKEPYVSVAYLSEEKAKSRAKAMKEDNAYRWNSVWVDEIEVKE